MAKLGYKRIESENIVEFELEGVQLESKSEVIEGRITKTITLLFPRYIRVSRRKRFEKLTLVKSSNHSDFYQKKNTSLFLSKISFKKDQHQRFIDTIDELLYRCDYKLMS